MFLQIAFEWKELADGAVVVDVGGGVGTSAIPIAREFPNLKVIVQDLPSVIQDAQEVWSKQMPDAVKSGRVVLEGTSILHTPNFHKYLLYLSRGR